jgi:pimeloyl-ACP methyl ester carboxylesterase
VLKVNQPCIHITNFTLQFAVGVVDILSFIQMCWFGFQHYRLPLSRFFSVFPYRPLTLVCRNVSPAPELSYWYRPHTSKTRSPILFLHGIGIGIHTYTTFFKDLVSQLSSENSSDDDQVGIIAIETMPVSMRLTKPALHRDVMVAQINKILSHHGWTDKIVVAAHSYGTITAAHLLHSETMRGLIGPLVLIDPVTLSIHLGEIPYNFIYRKPRLASEHQLSYFACKDMGAAHAITRRFDWSENVLWKDELPGRRTTVLLSGKDIIVDTEGLGNYLAANLLATDPTMDEGYSALSWKNREWRIDGLNIFWYDELNHAEIFDTRKDIKPLIEVITSYTAKVASQVDDRSWGDLLIETS